MRVETLNKLFIFTITLLLLSCGENASGFGKKPTPPLPPPPASSPPLFPRDSRDPNISVCPDGVTSNGMDVSNYNPGTSWSMVASSGGMQFAFIKASEGMSYVNPYFLSDWWSAKANGVYRGAYHFFHPGSDPHLQASNFLATVGTLDMEDLPAVLDWEVSDGVRPALQIANAKIWLEEVRAATGKTPLIYVSPGYWNSLGNPEEFIEYPLFIANYEVNCPWIPPPWSSWVFWQNAIGGPVPGVQAREVDRDTFRGSIQQMRNFAISGALP